MKEAFILNIHYYYNGNYSATRFTTELQTKMNAVERAATAGESAGKMHNFSLSVNKQLILLDETK